jgi:hypothetical protein
MADDIEKIKSWLEEENKFIITEEQQPECRFMLRVESKEKESFLTFYIFSVLDSNDKIWVY